MKLFPAAVVALSVGSCYPDHSQPQAKQEDGTHEIISKENAKKLIANLQSGPLFTPLGSAPPKTWEEFWTEELRDMPKPERLAAFDRWEESTINYKIIIGDFDVLQNWARFKVLSVKRRIQVDSGDLFLEPTPATIWSRFQHWAILLDRAAQESVEAPVGTDSLEAMRSISNNTRACLLVDGQIIVAPVLCQNANRYREEILRCPASLETKAFWAGQRQASLERLRNQRVKPILILDVYTKADFAAAVSR